MLPKLLWFCICFLPLPAFAAVVDTVPVQVGMFEKENCVSKDKNQNSCLCKADVFKAIVSKISPQAAQKINATLTKTDGTPNMGLTEEKINNIFARPDGAAEMELCEGHKVNANEKDTDAYRALGYKTVFNKASFLTISMEYGGYYDQAAHPFWGIGHYFFNTRTGNTYSYRDLFGGDLKALNNAIKTYLETHKPQMVDMGEDGNGEEEFSDVKESLENGWISANMIDERASDIYLSKKGLIYVFNAGHYISSYVDVVLPANIIKDKEVRKYVRSLNAS